MARDENAGRGGARPAATTSAPSSARPRSEQADYRRLAETAPGIMGIANLDGYLRLVNPAFCEVLGYDEAEVYATPFLSLVHPDDVDQVVRLLGDLAAGKRALPVTVRIRHANGSWRWFESRQSIDPVTGEVYFAGNDVTPHERLEQHLARRAELGGLVARLVRRLAQMSPVDVTGALTACLADLATVTGATRADLYELSGDHPQLVAGWVGSTPTPALAGPMPWLAAALRESECVTLAADTLPRAASKLATHLRASGANTALALQSGSPRAFLFVASPADEQPSIAEISLLSLLAGAIAAVRGHAAATAELARLNDELDRSNRELEHFAESAAHDMRLPLSSLLGHLDLALELLSQETPDLAGPHLEAVARAATRIDDLVSGLLNVARAGHAPAERRETTDLTSLVIDALEPFHDEVEHRRGTLRIEPLPTAHVDQALLREVFVNLVSNALRHAPAEGPVVIIGADPEPRDGQWLVWVHDNGSGVPTPLRDRIFTRFVRGEASTDTGFGIGLALCQRIIERHGGTIWVDDGPHGGARFCFTLPASAG